VNLNGETGWTFCQNLTDTVRAVNARAIQNAEFWPVTPAIVTPRAQNGAGCDVTQHDGLRDSVRQVITQASFGAPPTSIWMRWLGICIPRRCRMPGGGSLASKITTS
jgi:hypothetical protein